MDSQLAIDVGATGIKGALVDVNTGQLMSERIKYATPSPALPQKVLEVADQIIKDLEWKDKAIGIGFPAIVKNNHIFSATNIDQSWIDVDIKTLTKEVTGLDSYTLNDADAAGIAEMSFGNGIDKKGTVIMLTLGTGIGSGVFKDGILLPNIELGTLRFKDNVAEFYASNGARKREELSWEQYGTILNEVLTYFNQTMSPDLMIIGGGISKKFEKYGQFIDSKLNVIPAKLQNNAGIVGAAMYAVQKNQEQ